MSKRQFPAESPTNSSGSALLEPPPIEDALQTIDVSIKNPNFRFLPASIQRDLESPDRWIRMGGKPRPTPISEQDLTNALRSIFKKNGKPEQADGSKSD